MYRNAALPAAGRLALDLESLILPAAQPFLHRYGLALDLALSPERTDGFQWHCQLPGAAGEPRRELLLAVHGEAELGVWARAWGRWRDTPTEGLLLVHLLQIPDALGHLPGAMATARRLVQAWDQAWLYRNGAVQKAGMLVVRPQPSCPFRPGQKVVFTPPGEDGVMPYGQACTVRQVYSSHDLLQVDQLPVATCWSLFRAAE